MESARVQVQFPKMDVSSAVYPTVRVEGDSLHLAYYLPGCVDSAVVTFRDVSSWQYGEPNDEGLRSHPLWGRGLTPYNFHETEPPPSPDVRRWVATFHDGTFEVIASQWQLDAARVSGRTPAESLDAVHGPGANQVLDELGP